MPTTNRQPQRPRPSGRAAAAGPRRLGNQSPPRRPSGAERRYARSRQRRQPNWIAWGAVGLVVIAIVVLIVVKATSSTNSSSSNSSGADRNPAPAPAAEVKAVTTIPAAVFNQVGTAGQPVPFTVTKNQPLLSAHGLPRFVYEGGEFCPYCAVMRYAMVAALSRFGTFSNLKKTSSGPHDGNIPTFSFLGSSYKSPYVVFSPYEAYDRLDNPLQKVPADVAKLFLTYDGNATTNQPSKFNAGGKGGVGIPFLDVGNRYVSAGAPVGLYNLVSSGVLFNGGPGRLQVAQGIARPSTAVGKAIQGKLFIAQANYLSAAICSLTKQQPAAVCSSPGVQAAAKAIAAVKPVA